MRNEKTKILVECALMVALAVVLNFIKIAPWPQGGSITLAAMAPIVFLSLRRGWKWGLLGGVVYSLLQILLDGMPAPPTNNLFYFGLVVLLDYVLAYSVLGLADVFARIFSRNRFAPAIASCCVTLLRYCCHIVSGVLIWGVYAPEGWSAVPYAVVYNGSFMIPETIITAVAVTLLVRTVGKKLAPASAATNP